MCMWQLFVPTFNWLLLDDFMVTFVTLDWPHRGIHFCHLQPLAIYYAIKYNFQKIFLKLHLWLHIRLVTVADMVADATTVFLQFFLRIVFLQFV